MKVSIENLGVLKQAEFTLGDLTIICGENNTGKSYATYALFGFLNQWKDILSIDLDLLDIDSLLRDGTLEINIENLLDNQFSSILKEGCQIYTEGISTVFATRSENFELTKFDLDIPKCAQRPNIQYENEVISGERKILSFLKKVDEQELIVTLLVDSSQLKIPQALLLKYITDVLNIILFEPLLYNAFIVGAERTGTFLFRKELDFPNNRLLRRIARNEARFDPYNILGQFHHDYALPIKFNAEFTRKLESLSKRRSFVVEKHPQVIAYFSKIIDGDYSVDSSDRVLYNPNKDSVSLLIEESSSSVRSLLDIGFYLKHIAKPNDLLIIDEPELNLHPESQRRVARLIARLVNVGIKVFITTHSDYIVKEINTLMMLNQDKPHIGRIMAQEGYVKEELLSKERIRAYTSEYSEELQGCVLKPAEVNQEDGIEIASFDTAIHTMNRIQESIIWGEE